MPAHLAAALRLPRGRSAEIEAVELSAEVVIAARAHFGIRELEQQGASPTSNSLRVHTQCAVAWMREAAAAVAVAAAPAAAQPVDVLIVDLQGDESESLESSSPTGETLGGVRAPPSFALHSDFLSNVATVVGHTRPGLVAFNCIATPEGFRSLQHRLQRSLQSEGEAVQMWSVAPGYDDGDGKGLVQSRDSDGDSEILHRLLFVPLGTRADRGIQLSPCPSRLSEAMSEIGLVAAVSSCSSLVEL